MKVEVEYLTAWFLNIILVFKKWLMENKASIIKPYNKKDLTVLLGVSRFVLNKWLESLQEELGEVKGRYYTPNQVEIIMKRLGFPKQFETEINF